MDFKFNKTIIRITAMCMLFLIASVFCGCNSNTDMPFNGEISFHEISVTIPEDFIRDSSQSNDDMWAFEKDFYEKCIIISRTDINGDTTLSLKNYADYMEEQGAVSEVTTFSDKEAVHSTYTKDDEYCQEMLFAYNDSFYAVALRGGDENEFESLLSTVKINEATV